MEGQSYDPRSVANLVLDVAQELEIEISNLALQKLLYFAHGMFLINNKQPLVSGYFEAWQYGPVHPAAYKAFKAAGSSPIRFRATARDLLSGAERPIPEPGNPAVRELAKHVVGSLGRLSPGRLVDISHARGAPWEYIVDQSRKRVVLGLRIPDIVVIERFRYHKVSVGDVPSVGEPVEDSPFT